MSEKRPRQIGTTTEAIAKAEEDLGWSFPPSYRKWLLANNGRDLEAVNIFPVFDSRDPRKTWDSIVRNYRENWLAWLENFADDGRSFDHLMPFGDLGTGDFYCFDSRFSRPEGEFRIVRWSHETGETEFRADRFDEFAQAILGGEWDYD